MFISYKFDSFDSSISVCIHNILHMRYINYLYILDCIIEKSLY